MTLLLTDPVDSLCPPRLRLESTARELEQIECLWRSPLGFFCVGVNYMHEDGRQAFTILAYRTAETWP